MIPAWVSLVAAAVCGGLLALPFTVHDSSLLAWFALAPVFWLVAKAPSGWAAARIAAVFSLVWCGVSFSFLWRLVAPGMIALTIYSALFYIAALLCIRRVAVWGPVSGVVATAAIWTLTEILRSVVPVFGFPWLLLGHTLLYHDTLRQGADVFGVYGLSALIACANATLAFAVTTWLPERHRISLQFASKNAWKAVCLSGMLVFGTQMYGLTMVTRIAPRLVSGPPIGVVQGNVFQKMGRSNAEFTQILEDHIKLHEDLLAKAKERPVLVCWAETMVPGSINTDEEWAVRFKAYVKTTKLPALTGANYSLDNPKNPGDAFSYNSAYILDGDGAVVFKYFKRRLVAFGEYVPFTETLPFMKWLRSVTRDQYLRGETASPVYEIPPYRIATNICVEDIHPDLAAEAANAGANLIINVTNDGWFYKNFGPRAHLQAAAMRSIEVRRPMLRVTNTGYTVLIDPLGRMETLVPLESVGSALAYPLLLPAKGETTTYGATTIYMKLGNFWVSMIALGILILAGLSRIKAAIPVKTEIVALNAAETSS